MLCFPSLLPSSCWLWSPAFASVSLSSPRSRDSFEGWLVKCPVFFVPGKDRWHFIQAVFFGILEKTVFSLPEVSLLLIMMTSVYLVRTHKCLTKKNAFVTVSKYKVCLFHQNDTPRQASLLPSPYPDCSFANLPFFKRQCLFFIDVSALWQIHFSMKRNIINLSHLY